MRLGLSLLVENVRSYGHLSQIEREGCFYCQPVHFRAMKPLAWYFLPLQLPSSGFATHGISYGRREADGVSKFEEVTGSNKLR